MRRLLLAAACALLAAGCDDPKVEAEPADTGVVAEVADADGDGVPDSEDACADGDDTVDADGDGVADACDPCPTDVADDSDGDGVCDSDDACPDGDDAADADGDGTADYCDPCPADVDDDSDGDGVCDSDDTCPDGDDAADADGDGTADYCDPCPADVGDDSDGDGVCDTADACPGGDDAADGDGDGTADYCDPCPLDTADDSDGDGVCDSDDTCSGGDDAVDTDGDGTADHCDPCQLDAADDSDGDGVCDSDDTCPGGDDTIDTDGDGTADHCDPCPADLGDDTDGDGVCDAEDACPGGDDAADRDGDGTADHCDPCPLDAADDSDGDGVCDTDDICPGGNDAADADGDGTADHCDACPLDAADDSDGDGVCDTDDVCPGGNDLVDTDGDGAADHCDSCPLDATDDSDGDGVCDTDDVCPGGNDAADADGDGTADHCDACPLDAADDSDGDGVCDSDDVCPGGNDLADTDGDGTADHCDPCPLDTTDDSDGDGVCDTDDACPGRDDRDDFDGDGTPDDCDPCPLDAADDSDGDGICDTDDICPGGDDATDTDGDGTPDDCQSLGGFANCVPWTVPPDVESGYPGSGFYRTSHESSGPAWETFDINGDLLPDLVMLTDPDGYFDTFDTGLPTEHWKVYLNNGTGFDTTATAWPVPPDHLSGYPGSGFYRISHESSGPAWETFDINGDLLPDLVMLTDPDGYFDTFDTGLPTEHWKVYLNNGAGFDTAATAWPVPPDVDSGYPGSGFYRTSHESSGPAWETFDIDADGLPDLVMLTDPDGYFDTFDTGLPTEHWKVYLNNGTGFDTTAVEWSVPPDHLSGYPGSGFYRISHESSGPAWETFDIDADGLPDLVMLTDPDGYFDTFDTGLPTEHWKVYFNNGTGFDTAATAWPVPPDDASGYPGSGFYRTAHESSGPAWATFDINADHLPDLVMLTNPDGYFETFDVGLPSEHWQVYVNDGAGFATAPEKWTVPPDDASGYPGSGFYRTSHESSGPAWETFDLDSDGLPDIVQVTDPDGYYETFGAGTGTEWWCAYGANPGG